MDRHPFCSSQYHAFLHPHALVILLLVAEKVSSSVLQLETGFLFLELLFLFLASLQSPGYCVDMEGEEDVEKATLLNKEDNLPGNRGSICKECGIKRPLRSCHCAASPYPSLLTRRCDKCVVRFDHHDILINNCVGYGNQHYYVLFLLFGIVDSFLFLLKASFGPIFRYGVGFHTFFSIVGFVVVRLLSLSHGS